MAVGGTNIFGLDAEDIFTEIETGLEGLGLISFGSGYGGVPEVEAEGGRFGVGAGREERFLRRRDWQREWRVESRLADWEEAFTINRQAGIVLVTTFPDTMQKVAEYLEAVEGSVHRQVLIQAKIIEVTLNDGFQYGINWKVIANRFKSPSLRVKQIPSFDPAINGIFQAVFSSRDVSVLIEALSEQGEVNVLSSPKISTLNNQKAVINVGTQDVFFKVERVRVGSDSAGNPVFETVSTPFYVSLGVTLDVTPQISRSGSIIMNIHPTVTEKLEDVISPAGDVIAPNYTVREADTVIKARDGETVVIAGLMKDRETINEQMVPVLGNIPFLGRLFRNTKRTTEKTDLVILLTPTVMVGETVEVVSARP
jgi:MSHA type pilus biogenesis protein MshL